MSSVIPTLKSGQDTGKLVTDIKKQKILNDQLRTESFMNYEDAYSNETNKITINILITIMATTVLYFVFKKI